MPKLELTEGNQDDDINKVDVRDFIKNARRWKHLIISFLSSF